MINIADRKRTYTFVQDEILRLCKIWHAQKVEERERMIALGTPVHILQPEPAFDGDGIWKRLSQMVAQKDGWRIDEETTWTWEHGVVNTDELSKRKRT